MPRELTFRRRERRRARIKRGLLVTSLLSVAALVAGVPATSGPLELISALRRPPEQPRASGPDSSRSSASIARFRRKVFEARPTPAPRPKSSPEAPGAATEPTTSGSVTEIIYSAAAEFGLAADYLLSVASCESTLDPSAYNEAGYYGLFQFDQETWAAYGYGSIYDPVAQSRTAARLLAAGQSSRWPNCA